MISSHGALFANKTEPTSSQRRVLVAMILDEHKCSRMITSILKLNKNHPRITCTLSNLVNENKGLCKIKSTIERCMTMQWMLIEIFYHLAIFKQGPERIKKKLRNVVSIFTNKLPYSEIKGKDDNNKIYYTVHNYDGTLLKK